jgi:hypothetical protein
MVIISPEHLRIILPTCKCVNPRIPPCLNPDDQIEGRMERRNVLILEEHRLSNIQTATFRIEDLPAVQPLTPMPSAPNRSLPCLDQPFKALAVHPPIASHLRIPFANSRT